MSAEQLLANILPAPSGFQVVNNYTTSQQQFPAVAGPDSLGRTFIVWNSLGQDDPIPIIGDWGVFGQFYDQDGSRDGGEIQINTETTDNQNYPDVCVLDDDSWVVVWESNLQDGSGSGIYGQKFLNGGARAGGEFLINTITANSQRYPKITALNGNGYVVLWGSTNSNPNSPMSLYFQRFNSTGPVGGETAVGTANDSLEPAIAKLSDGGFYVVWVYVDSSASARAGIFGQRFDSTGNTVSSQIEISPPTATFLFQPGVAQLPNGELLVVWADRIELVAQAGIYGQRMSVDGTKVGSVLKINTQQLPLSTNTFEEPHIILENNTVLITYTTRFSLSTSVYFQRLDLNLNKISPEIAVGTLEKYSFNLRGLVSNGKLTFVWTEGTIVSVDVVKADNVAEFFIIFNDKATNSAQNYPYIEDSIKNPTVNLGRVLVSSAASKVTLRYQLATANVGKLQFGVPLPPGITLTPYNEDTRMIEISGYATAVNQMPDLEFVPFMHANANVDVSVEAAENDDWVNAIKIPNAKHLIGTKINNAIVRNNKALPDSYDVPLVLKDYFNDVEGFAGVTFKLFVGNQLLYTLGSQGGIITDDTAGLSNVPLVLVNNATAFRVIQQTDAVTYRVEAIDGFFTAELEWRVPALAAGKLSVAQKGIIFGLKVTGYVSSSILGAIVLYSPYKMIRNYFSRRAFSHELDRLLTPKVDPEHKPTESIFWILFAEPTIKRIFSANNFYRFRGGVSDREIVNIAEDLQTLFNNVYSRAHQLSDGVALVDTIEQLQATILDQYQILYRAAIAAAKAQIEQETQDQNNPENTIRLLSLSDEGSIATAAEADINNKKLELLRNATKMTLADSPLKARVIALQRLIVTQSNDIIIQHAQKGGKKWYANVAVFGKRLLRGLHLKNFASSRTVSTNMVDIEDRIFAELQTYATAHGITTNVTTQGPSYAVGQLAFTTAGGASITTNPISNGGESDNVGSDRGNDICIRLNDHPVQTPEDQDQSTEEVANTRNGPLNL